MMGSMGLIALLLLVIIVENVQGQNCGQPMHVTNHNWYERPGTAKRQFHLRSSRFVLDHPSSTAILFTTRVYNCPDEGVLITTAVSGNYMANVPTGSSALGSTGSPGSSFPSDHPTLFEYSSSGTEGLGKLKSMTGNPSYVSEGSNGVLKLSDYSVEWESLPAVTVCGSEAHAENSPMQSMIALDDEPDAPTVPMNVEVNYRGQLDVKEIFQKDRLFQFSVEKYDLMERYDENGELVICDAVILSSSNMIFVEPEDDDVREEEIGYLPHIPYSRVNLKFTDDVAMKPYFTYLRPDTVNQTSIGNRHFKVFEHRPGYYRLMSVMRQDRYLSIIKVDNRIVLGLSALDESLENWEISYDFSFDIPDLLRHRCKPPVFH
ncbi:uncharacterized protein [Watersipora subatra]|uniref:uncharacterized protein n=1 Tax=Watersipora subatra TaxID=2589382 RepID=UPI00355BDCCB